MNASSPSSALDVYLLKQFSFERFYTYRINPPFFLAKHSFD